MSEAGVAVLGERWRGRGDGRPEEGGAVPDPHRSGADAGSRTQFGSGLPASGQDLYRSIHLRGKVRHDELSSPATVRSDLDALMKLGLVVSEGGWVTAIPYHQVMAGLVAEEARILEQALETVRDTRWRLHALLREGISLSGDSPGTVLSTRGGDERADGCPYGARTRPHTDLAAMQPGTRFSQELLNATLKWAEADIAAGIRFRVVYQTGALSHPPSAECLRRMEQLGGQVRLSANLPFRLMLIDGKTAVCHLPGQDGPDETLLLQGTGVLALLRRLFETTWLDSVPLSAHLEDQRTAGEEDVKPAPVLTREQKAIVRYLADGATDQAIAHSLGVTPRTVTRRVTEIYQVLRVRSRFQAGVMARRMGLV